MLRKKCQSLLDDVGLDNYHIQINEAHKILEIVGECGQSFVSIHGIRLSRMAPNDKEIELALELFEAFLVKHTATFKEYIKAKHAANLCHIPKEVEGLTGCSIYRNAYQDTYTLTFKTPNNDSRNISIGSNGQVSFTAFSMDLNECPASDIFECPSEEEIALALKWLEDCNEYQELTDKAESLKNKLSSCEI